MELDRGTKGRRVAELAGCSQHAPNSHKASTALLTSCSAIVSDVVVSKNREMRRCIDRMLCVNLASRAERRACHSNLNNIHLLPRVRRLTQMGYTYVHAGVTRLLHGIGMAAQEFGAAYMFSQTGSWPDRWRALNDSRRVDSAVFVEALRWRHARRHER